MGVLCGSKIPVKEHATFFSSLLSFFSRSSLFALSPNMSAANRRVQQYGLLLFLQTIEDDEAQLQNTCSGASSAFNKYLHIS